MKALVELDHKLTNQIRTWGQPMYGFWKFIASQSIALFVIAAVAFAYAGDLVLWQFLLVFLSAYVIANLLQRLVKRHRPDFEKLTGYRMWIHTYSYPSAHATMSASSAVALCLLTTFPTSEIALITTICAIALAFLIGISRLIVGVHYLADVTFGWLLGFVIALGYVLVFA